MVALDKPDNLVELVESRIERFADRPWFGTPDANGHYAWITYGRVGERIDALRAGLSRLGVGPQDAVGVIANNSVDWAVAAYATFGLRGRFIPMYEKELPRVWRHIIADAGIKVLFVAKRDVRDQIDAMRDHLPGLEHLLLIPGNTQGCMAELEDRGRRHPCPSIRPQPNDIAVLIYTSGTTGDPKGVLLSHGNLTSNVIAGSKLFPDLNEHSRSLSILPWAHSYGQTAELHTFTYLGASIAFVRDVTTIAEDMANARPTFLIAVPRVFNKIHDALWSKINATGGLARKLLCMGLAAAEQCRTRAAQNRGTLWPRLKYRIADAVVFKKIRQRFGGRLSGALTASAMMNGKVAQFFADAGLPVYDCYGLSETSPAVTVSCPSANKPGSVGRPIDKVTVVIDRQSAEDDEGEIVVYGPNVMHGYHNKPDATQAIMTQDGGLRTGDQGRLDEEGYLFITGRIKEQYKLENGKYVFPAGIEEEIQLSPWVDNVLVFGEGRVCNVCLVVPDFEALKPWAENQGYDSTPAALIQNPAAGDMICQAIQNQLKGKFGGYEIPKSVVLIKEGFSVENGMLTQTLKLKRRKVIERYSRQIESAYAAV